MVDARSTMRLDCVEGAFGLSRNIRYSIVGELFKPSASDFLFS